MAFVAGSERSIQALHDLIYVVQRGDDPHALRSLESSLARWRGRFGSLLDHAPPKAEHRAEIQKGMAKIDSDDPSSINATAIEWTIMISDQLALDEHEAAGLLTRALQTTDGDDHQSTIAQAVRFFFDDRKYLLAALLELLQLAGSSASELSDIAERFVDSLFSGLRRPGAPAGATLSAVLLKTYTQLSSMISGPAQDTRGAPVLNTRITCVPVEELLEYYSQERDATAQCIFHLSRMRGLERAEVVELAGLLSTMNSQHPTDGTATVTLFMAAAASLDNFHPPPETETALQLTEFFGKMEAVLSRQWLDPSLQAAVHFVRYLYQVVLESKSGREILSDQVLQSISRGVFQFFANSALKPLTNTTLATYFQHQVDELMTNFLRCMHRTVLKLRDSEMQSFALHQLDPVRMASRPVRNDFETLLVVLCKVYSNRPESGLKFWERPEGPHESLHLFPLYSFLLECIITTIPSVVVAFYRLVAVLAHGPICAQKAYEFMSDNQMSTIKPITWGILFHAMNAFYSQNAPEQPSLEPAMDLDELDRYLAVLSVLEVIVTDDEVIRTGLFTDPSIPVVLTLFRFFVCRIPTSLKAAVLRVLSGFALSPECAPFIWHCLNTIPLLSNNNATIEVDLNEAEARAGEYKQTIAFLRLIDNLTAASGPSVDLTYYMNFIRETVFVRSFTRNYNDPAELPLILSLCTSIFHRLLGLVPADGEFKNVDAATDLVMRLLSKESVLSSLFDIIDNAVEQLAKPGSTYGPAVANTLRIFIKLMSVQARVLARFNQRGFEIEQYRASRPCEFERRLLEHSSVILQAALLVNATDAPVVGQLAVEFISCLAQSPHMTAGQVRGNRLVDIFSDAQYRSHVMNAFIVCLQNDAFLEDNVDIRIAVVDLMLKTVHQPHPNLATMLLGFDILKPARMTKLHDPRSPIARHSCLPVVLRIVDSQIDDHSGSIWVTNPELAWRCYSLVYALCEDPQTYPPIMTFLRSIDGSFIAKHVRHMPLWSVASIESSFADASARINAYNAGVSYLLRTAALELRLSQPSGLREPARRLLDVLFANPDVLGEQGDLNADQPRMRMLELFHLLDFGRQDTLESTIRVLDAWKQVVIVALESDQIEYGNLLQLVTQELLSAILPRLVAPCKYPHVLESLAQVALALMTSLRERRDGLGLSTVVLPNDQLHTFLRDIVAACVLPGTSQSFRGRIYGTLLHYLHYTASQVDFGELSAVEQAQQEERDIGNLEHIVRDGRRLTESVCRDALGAAGMWKCVSLAALDGLVVLSQRRGREGDGGMSPLRFLLDSDFIRAVVAVIRTEDNAVRRALLPRADHRIPLYEFEARVSLLLRVAQTEAGARAVLEAGVVEAFAESGVLQIWLQVSDAGGVDMDAGGESPLARFHNILQSMLRLQIALLSVRQPLRDAPRRIVAFVMAHGDLLGAILRDGLVGGGVGGGSGVLLDTLHLLYLLASASALGGTALETPLLRFQEPIVQLLKQLCDGGSTNAAAPVWPPRASFGASAVPVSSEDEAAQLAVRRLVLAYVRAVSCDALTSDARVVFVPFFDCRLSDAAVQPAAQSGASGAPGTSLAVVVQALKAALEALPRSLKAHGDLVFKLENFKDLAYDQLSEFAPEEAAPDMKRGLAAKGLRVALGLQAAAISTHVYIVESSLLILWRHIEHFLLVDAQRVDRAQFRVTGRPNAAAQLRSDVLIQLHPLLDISQDLVEKGEMKVSEWSSHGTFIKMVCRRIKSVVAAAGRSLSNN